MVQGEKRNDYFIMKVSKLQDEISVWQHEVQLYNMISNFTKCNFSIATRNSTLQAAMLASQHEVQLYKVQFQYCNMTVQLYPHGSTLQHFNKRHGYNRKNSYRNRVSL